MNKSGQLTTYFVTLMIGVVIIIMAMALAPTIKNVISDARSNSTSTTLGLNCSDSTINNYNKATCLFSDISLPAFVGSVIFIAGGIIGAKLLIGQ